MSYIPANISISSDTILQINQALTRINSRTKGFDYKVDLTSEQIAREAVLYFRWVVEQVDEGKAVVSTNLQGTDFQQVSTPNFPATRPVK